MGSAPQRKASPSLSPGRRPSARTLHEKHLLGVIRRQLPIDVTKAGGHSIPLTELAVRKIGSTAFRVFDALLQSRDLNGITHASLAGIARKAAAPVEETNHWPRKKLSEKTVRNAIEKLVRLGLVENMGWTYRDVPCADPECVAAGLPAKHLHKVYLRKVLGVVMVKPDAKELFTLEAPKATADALRKTEAHGGARANVGRPPGTKDSKPRRRWRDPSLDMPVEVFDRGPTPVAPPTATIGPGGRAEEAPITPGRFGPKRAPQAGPGRDSSRAGENQDGRPIKSIGTCSSVLRTSEQDPSPKMPGDGRVAPLGKSKSESPEKPPAVDGGATTGQGTAPSPSKPATPPDSAPKPGGRFLSRNPSVGGIRLAGGSGGLAGLVALHGPRGDEDEWSPPFPGPTVFTRPRVPEPPQLPRDLAPDEKASYVARAYRTTVRARYDVPCMTLARVSDIETTREFPDLLASADLLIRHGIAPIAWAAWSVDVWRHYGKGNRPPSIRWVFSPKRIEKWHGWFHNEESGYKGGRLLSVPAFNDLYTRFERVKFAVMRGVSKSEAVAQHLPRELYETLLAQARAQVAEIQLDLQRQVQAGKFIW